MSIGSRYQRQFGKYIETRWKCSYDDDQFGKINPHEVNIVYKRNFYWERVASFCALPTIGKISKRKQFRWKKLLYVGSRSRNKAKSHKISNTVIRRVVKLLHEAYQKLKITQVPTYSTRTGSFISTYLLTLCTFIQHGYKVISSKAHKLKIKARNPITLRSQSK